MLPAIATAAEAAALGFVVTDAQLRRASARVRLYTGQQITPGTSTLRVDGPVVKLPQRPVDPATVQVVRVTDAAPVAGWKLAAGGVLNLDAAGPGPFDVTWSHGFTTTPDALVEIVATIAARLAGLEPEGDAAPLAAGVQTEGNGPWSRGFGMDAANGVADLTTGERRALDRVFPKVHRSLTMGAG